MPPADPFPDPARRLADLDLPGTHRGWVPDQPGLAHADASPPALDPENAAPPPKPPAWPALADLTDRLPPWLRATGVDARPGGAALAGLLAVCALLLVVTGWSLLHRGGGAAPSVTTGGYDTFPTAPATALPVAPSPSPSGIVVDVGGRVRRPGLVTLPPGARVADALDAAGGALRRRDLRTVDLAARVTDGQLLLVGVPGAAGAAPTGTSGSGAAAGPVNLNSATVDQLDQLPGIGPVLAQRIVDYRSAHGGFRAVGDLNQVSGIGDAIFAEISPLVTV